MNDEAFDKLIGLFLDDEISEQQLKELVSVCKEDRDRLEELQFHLEMSDRLFQYEMESRSEERFLNGLRSRVRATSQKDNFLDRFVVKKKSVSGDQVNSTNTSRLLNFQQPLAWVSLSLCLVTLALLGYQSQYFWKPNQKATADKGNTTQVRLEDHEEVDQGVAMVTKVWRLRGIVDREVKNGTSLSPGVIEFESGLMQLEFYSGARLVVEGPAKLDVLSPFEVICHYGNLRASVPDMAKGFTVKAPELSIVDQGTEFAVSVDRQGETDVHVVEGLVDLVSQDAAGKKQLKTGEAISVFNGESKVIENRGREFASPKILSSLVKNTHNSQTNRWNAFLEELSSSEHLVVGFPFERDDDEDRLLKGFSSTLGEVRGAIVGCQWVEGRWPGKMALEFKRPGDAIRIKIPGKYRSVTYSAWLRVDGVDRRFSSLLLTDRWHYNTPHWQIHRKGTFALGIRHPPSGPNQRLESKPIFNAFQLGRWIHLVTVYDRDKLEVVHYVNGKMHKRVPIAKEASGFLTFGKSTIGNWVNPNGPKRKVRALNGRMDELLLFSKALSESEVAHIYEQGKPTH